MDMSNEKLSDEVLIFFLLTLTTFHGISLNKKQK